MKRSKKIKATLFDTYKLKKELKACMKFKKKKGEL